MTWTICRWWKEHKPFEHRHQPAAFAEVIGNKKTKYLAGDLEQIKEIGTTVVLELKLAEVSS
ncbi:MAG: hypothetical protein WCT31_04490 [Candidatus Micrarchaeia archaeon]|jgi:hypothetical protein